MIIFAVTVTYGNRFHLLKQVIDSAFTEGVAKIIVVDNNSETESKEKLKAYEKELGSDKIKVLYLDDNYGSAGGFKRGLEEAFNDEKCEYILTLDDDNVLMERASKKLYKYKRFFDKKSKNYLICFMRDFDYLYDFLNGNSKTFNPSFYRGFNVINLIKKKVIKRKYKNNYRKCNIIPVAPYGGLFFNKKILGDIGFPNEKFYLYADDFEYTYRISKNYKIILLKNLKLQDIDLSWNYNTRKFLYHPFINDGTEIKTYYLFRNSDYLEKYVFNKKGISFIINKYIYLFLLFIIALMNFKFRRILTILRALNDSKDLK